MEEYLINTMSYLRIRTTLLGQYFSFLGRSVQDDRVFQNLNFNQIANPGEALVVNTVSENCFAPNIILNFNLTRLFHGKAFQLLVKNPLFDKHVTMTHRY